MTFERTLSPVSGSASTRLSSTKKNRRQNFLLPVSHSPDQVETSVHRVNKRAAGLPISLAPIMPFRVIFARKIGWPARAMVRPLLESFGVVLRCDPSLRLTTFGAIHGSGKSGCLRNTGQIRDFDKVHFCIALRCRHAVHQRNRNLESISYGLYGFPSETKLARIARLCRSS